jgi:hypothetical protein
MLGKILKHIFLEPTARNNWDKRSQVKTARRESAAKQIVSDDLALPPKNSAERKKVINEALEIYRVKRKMIDDLPPGPKAKLELMAKVLMGIPATEPLNPSERQPEDAQPPSISDKAPKA